MKYTDRYEMTDVMNAADAVLTFNLDTLERDYSNYEAGSKCKVTEPIRGRTFNCYLGLNAMEYTGQETEWYIAPETTRLVNDLTMKDWMSFANSQSYPMLNEGKTIAIMIYSEKRGTVEVQTVKMQGRVDPFCTIVVKLVPAD